MNKKRMTIAKYLSLAEAAALTKALQNVYDEGYYVFEIAAHEGHTTPWWELITERVDRARPVPKDVLEYMQTYVRGFLAGRSSMLSEVGRG